MKKKTGKKNRAQIKERGTLQELSRTSKKEYKR